MTFSVVFGSLLPLKNWHFSGSNDSYYSYINFSPKWKQTKITSGPSLSSGHKDLEK